MLALKIPLPKERDHTNVETREAPLAATLKARDTTRRTNSTPRRHPRGD